MKKVIGSVLIFTFAVLLMFSLFACNNNNNDNGDNSSIEHKLHSAYFFTATDGYYKVHVAPDWIYFCDDGLAYIFVENPLIGTATIASDFHEDDVFIPATPAYETSLYKVSYTYNAKEEKITITPKQPIPIIKPKANASRHIFTTGRDLGLGNPGFLKSHYYYSPEDIEITYFRETTIQCKSYPAYDEWVSSLEYDNENQKRCHGSYSTSGFSNDDLQHYLDNYPIIDICIS